MDEKRFQNILYAQLNYHTSLASNDQKKGIKKCFIVMD